MKTERELTRKGSLQVFHILDSISKISDAVNIKFRSGHNADEGYWFEYILNSDGYESLDFTLTGSYYCYGSTANDFMYIKQKHFFKKLNKMLVSGKSKYLFVKNVDGIYVLENTFIHV